MMDSDELNNPNFESVIQDFCRITSKKFSVFEIAPVIVALQTSNLLDYISKTPNDAAITCLKTFLYNNPHLPQQFVGRFLSVVNTEINVLPNPLRVTNQSFVTKVVARRVIPPDAVTNFSVAAMKQTLRSDIDKSSVHITATSNVVPNELKLRINQRTLSLIINSMSDLCSTIMEGNRAQGRRVDSYIRSHIKHS